MGAYYFLTARMLLLGLFFSVFPGSAQKLRRNLPVAMKATAYAQHGVTKSGEHTRRGIIAADPRVLPLHTRVKVTNAGPYSGHYIVKDTGRLIKGRKVDIFMPSRREAKQFGIQSVKVEVVQAAPPTQ
jgi:3D (Asp-Asp-Asp) domain-containing protein